MSQIALRHAEMRYNAGLPLWATVRGGGMVVEPGESIERPGVASPEAETGQR